MKKSFPFKRILSLLLCLTILLGLMPEFALAVGNSAPSTEDMLLEVTESLLHSAPSPVSSDPDRYTENATVSVTYNNESRTQATVKFHKPGVQAFSYNLIFLIDVSVQGKEAALNFKKMMYEGGAGAVYDHAAENQVSFITYTQLANASRISNKGDLQTLASQITPGTGTASELRALEKAIGEVEQIKNEDAANQRWSKYPTVVFWVLGDKVLEKNSPEFSTKINTLKQELENSPAKGALITWQLGTDTPDLLLKQYATEHTGAHDDTPVKAAYASSDPVQFRLGMRDTLESVVHDHYHNITFNLALADDQTIIKDVKSIDLESRLGSAQITATPAPDRKSVVLHLDYMCQQLDYDLLFDVELKEDVYEKQTVFKGDTFAVKHDNTNGGIHTGIFDDTIESGLTITYPDAVIDRTRQTISFDAVGGSGATPTPLQALTGERVILPDGVGLTRMKGSVSEYFGGWRTDSGKYFRPGAEVVIPEGGMTLKAAYGHLEVEVDVAGVTASTIANNLKVGKLRDITNDEGWTQKRDKVVSIHVIDKEFRQYGYDQTTRKLNDLAPIKESVPDAVAAYHLGTIEMGTGGLIDNRAVGYFVPAGTDKTTAERTAGLPFFPPWS